MIQEAHTVVKCKVNTRRFKDSLMNAFECLRDLAEESGAPKGLECLQVRESEKIILIGLPGTHARIEAGDFPPADALIMPEHDETGGTEL